MKDRSLTEFRVQIIEFVRRFHEENQDTPSLRKIVEGCKTYRSKFYKAFPGGMREACEEAGVIFEETRAKQVEKATTSKAREEREKIQKPLGKLEEEIKADEAEARLEEAKRREAAEERAIKARNELIEIEAKHDPKKVIPYLRALELEIVAPFFDLCKEEKLTPRRAWDEAVKVRGESWAEWGRAFKAGDEEPCFKAYISDVIEAYIPQKRLELARGRHRGKTYSCKCEKCGLRYESQDKKGYTLFTCPNRCVQDHGGCESIYPCPVCGELGNRINLSYDRSQNILSCMTCGFEGEVRDPRLEPKGTKAGTFKHPIEELRAEKAKLIREVSSLRGSKADLTRKCDGEKARLMRFREETAEWLRRCEGAKKKYIEQQDRARKMEEENDDIAEKIDIINSVYLFVMAPERLDGYQLRDFLTQVENAIEMRKRPGKLGESMKLTVKLRDKFIRVVAGDDLILKSQADKRREREIDKLKAECEEKLKVKDTIIDAERRRRTAAEALRRECTKKIEEQRTEYDGKITEFEDEVQRLEGELETLFEEKEALEEELSSGPRSQPQPTLGLRVIKRGVS